MGSDGASMNSTIHDEVHIVRQGYACKMIVNGVDIGENYCINDEELLNALTRSGEFYPFTCDCGEPECAGILAPVCCQKNATLMTWHKKYPAPERSSSITVLPNGVRESLPSADITRCIAIQ